MMNRFGDNICSANLVFKETVMHARLRSLARVASFLLAISCSRSIAQEQKPLPVENFYAKSLHLTNRGIESTCSNEQGSLEHLTGLSAGGIGRFACMPSEAARQQFPETSEWQPAAAFGGQPLWFAAAFVIGDRAYVGTGYGPTTEFWQYDPGTDGWTRKADFAGAARGAAVAFSIGDKGYIGTGFSNSGQCWDFWEYDPSANRWTQKAPLLAAPRDHAGAFVIGQKAYVVSGTSGDGAGTVFHREVWEYEPVANHWTRRADLPEAAAAPACFVLNGKGYVGTGIVGQSASMILSHSLFEYDPQTDSWTRRAPFPGPARFSAIGFSMYGAGYLGTGFESVEMSYAVAFRDLWRYAPQTDEWTQVPDLSGDARGAAVAFTLGARAYIGTGANSSSQPLRDFWTWEMAASSLLPPDGGSELGARAIPNPFASATTIAFRLESRQDVRVQILSPSGRLIRVLPRTSLGPGMVSLVWDGKDSDGISVGSGVYVYRILRGHEMTSGKVLFMK
jgi:N-acetylneuraminic acid mutarotase